MTAVSPQHYKRADIEAIDVIDAYFHDNHSLGTALKYLLRLGHKDDEGREIGKLIWYLLHHLKRTGQKLPDLRSLIDDYPEWALNQKPKKPKMQGFVNSTEITYGQGYDFGCETRLEVRLLGIPHVIHAGDRIELRVIPSE